VAVQGSVLDLLMALQAAETKIGERPTTLRQENGSSPQGSA
jgi:hypothetical protein